MDNNKDLEKIKQKVFDVLDENLQYSQADLEKDLAQYSMPIDPNSFKINFNFVNKSTNLNPEYATVGSSGFDLRADLEETIVLKVGERRIIPTGLFFEIPEGFEIQIRPRSGLAAKNGVTVLNTPGTIDADYRGEVKIILINLGDVPFTVAHGDRIAQAVIQSVYGKNVINLNQIDEITDKTLRSAGGFGSTGTN